MADLGDPILGDFLEETEELLQSLELCVNAGRESVGKEVRYDEIERVLHTIKGNASAFDLREFAHSASKLLYRIRRVRRQEKDWLDAGGRLLLIEFVRLARDLLKLTRQSVKPDDGFFSRVLGALDEDFLAAEAGDGDAGGALDLRDGGGDGIDGEGAAGGGGGPAVDAEVAAEEDAEYDAEYDAQEIATILAAAPPVRPRIREIVELARRELRRERTGMAGGFCPDDEVAVTEAISAATLPPLEFDELTEEAATPARRDDEEPVGPPGKEDETRKVEPAPALPFPGGQDEPLAVPAETEAEAADDAEPEVLPGAAAPRRLPSERGRAFEASCLRQGIRAVLDAGGLGEEVSGILSRVDEFLETLARGSGDDDRVPARDALLCGVEGSTALGSRLSVDVEDADIRLLPALGELVRNFLVEVCDALFAVGSGRLDRVVVRVRRSGSGTVTFAVIGLPEVRKTITRLRMLPFRKRVEGLGGRIREEKGGRELALELPDDFRLLEVLLVRTGDTKLAFPAHRVAEVMDPRSGAPSSKQRSVEFRGRRAEILDLTSPGVSGGSVVVLDAQGGFQAVRVDRVVERREMLVQVASSFESHGDVFGFCVDVSDWSRIPLLAALLS